MKTISSVPIIISLFLIVAGTLFKLMHWPGAGIMTVLGFSTLSTVILLLAVLIRSAKEYSPTFQKVLKAGMFSFSIFSLGILFRIQHWPGGEMMFLIGGAGSGLILPFIAWKHFNSETDKLNKSAVIIGLFSIFVALLALGASWRNSKSYLEEIKGWDEATAELSNCKSSIEMSQTMTSELIPDSLKSTSDSLYNEKKLFTKHAEELHAFIETIRNELISHCVPEYGDEADTLHPSAFGRDLVLTEISTYYLVGDNPNDPQGVAADMKKKLKDLESEYLKLTAEKTLFGDQFADKEINNIRECWEEREFYVVSLGKVLVKLKKLQLLVCESQINVFNLSGR